GRVAGAPAAGRAADPEAPWGLRGAEPLGRPAPGHDPAGQHPDMAGRPAGAGAEHEGDLHARTTLRRTERRSPPSAAATTARKAASTAALASTVTATLGRKPVTRIPDATPSPATVPATAPASPATAAR